MRLLQVYEEFILDKQILGLSHKTIESYNEKVSDFVGYVGDKPVKNLEVIDIKKYVLFLQQKVKKNGEKLSTVTIQTNMRHIRAFLNYIYEKKYSDINYCREIKLPKANKPVTEILTDEEIALIFSYYKNANTEHEYRNKAIIALLLDTGIRASELCSINIDDVNFNYNYIKIHGKGNKERLVKMSLITKRFIYQYIHHRCIATGDEKALFTSKGQKRLTYNSMKCFVNKLKHELDIKKLHIHLFRHTFATRKILIDKLDLFSLQVALGHESLEMCRKYSHISSQYQVLGIDFKPFYILVS